MKISKYFLVTFVFYLYPIFAEECAGSFSISSIMDKPVDQLTELEKSELSSFLGDLLDNPEQPILSSSLHPYQVSLLSGNVIHERLKIDPSSGDQFFYMEMEQLHSISLSEVKNINATKAPITVSLLNNTQFEAWSTEQNLSSADLSLLEKNINRISADKVDFIFSDTPLYGKRFREKVSIIFSMSHEQIQGFSNEMANQILAFFMGIDSVYVTMTRSLDPESSRILHQKQLKLILESDQMWETILNNDMSISSELLDKYRKQ